MAASQPAIELQRQSEAGDGDLQRAAEDHPPNANTARGSLGIDLVPATTGQGVHHQGGSAPQKGGRWSATTVETEAEAPSWPFREDHQAKAPDQSSGLKNAHQPSRLRHVLRHWCLEILTFLVTVALMAAIIILLCLYDGEYMPEWPFSINLNTVIALLSTFLRAAMLAAVAEILGQIKWEWFTERTRPLHHLQDFDSASRSMIGSLRLLVIVMWNGGWTSAGILGMFAALITVTSLAVAPFTQQALKTAMCPRLLPGATAAIPAANYVPGTSSYYRIGAGMYEVEVDMKGAMIEGLTYPDGKDSAVEVTCGGSNCSFNDYGTGITHGSIGLCSACLDTTEYVSGPDEGGNLTLPDTGAFINYGPGAQYFWAGRSNLTWASDLFSEDFATASSVAIHNFSMLLATTSPCTQKPNSGFYDCPHNVSSYSMYNGLGDYIAASCTIYPCAKEYHGSYSGSKFTERVVRTQTALPNKQETTDSYSFYYNYTALRSPCILDDGDSFTQSNLTDPAAELGTWYTLQNMTTAPDAPGRTWANISLTDPSSGEVYNSSVPNACLYKMDGIYAMALEYFMSGTLFRGDCTYDDMQSGQLNCGDAWWLTPLWLDMNATFATLDAAIDDFAVAVTNKLRSTGSGPDVMLGDGPTEAVVLGLAFENSTCTYFDWQWLLMPVALVLLCGLLLVWTLIKSYRDPDQPVWKGSVLPLIFLGLHAPGASSRQSDEGRDRLSAPPRFMKDNGRSTTGLNEIKEDAGRTWVRFHGGTEPGFLDLGTAKSSRDAEASVASLLTETAGGKRESQSPDGMLRPGSRRRSRTLR